LNGCLRYNRPTIVINPARFFDGEINDLINQGLQNWNNSVDSNTIRNPGSNALGQRIQAFDITGISTYALENIDRDHLGGRDLTVHSWENIEAIVHPISPNIQLPDNDGANP
jgi:hypothetical protein